MSNSLLSLHHNGAVEAGMDVQVLAGRRVVADHEEARLLREIATLTRQALLRIERLRLLDAEENSEHLEIEAAGRRVCARLEKTTAAASQSNGG